MSPDDVEMWNKDITDIERHFGNLPEDHNDWILDTIPPVDQRHSFPSPIQASPDVANSPFVGHHCYPINVTLIHFGPIH